MACRAADVNGRVCVLPRTDDHTAKIGNTRAEPGFCSVTVLASADQAQSLPPQYMLRSRRALMAVYAANEMRAADAAPLPLKDGSAQLLNPLTESRLGYFWVYPGAGLAGAAAALHVPGKRSARVTVRADSAVRLSVPQVRVQESYTQLCEPGAEISLSSD